MQGFGVEGPTAHFAEKFHVFFIEDTDDHERVQKRMQITRDLYEKRGITTTVISLEGGDTCREDFASASIGRLGSAYAGEPSWC